MEKEIAIEDICPYLKMEDDDDGNGYYRGQTRKPTILIVWSVSLYATKPKHL